MNEVKFKREILKKYNSNEKLKRLKIRVIDTVKNTFILEKSEIFDTLFFDLVPYFEYITLNRIEFGNKKPEKDDVEFRGENINENNAKYYEKYTLWGIHSMM